MIAESSVDMAERGSTACSTIDRGRAGRYCRRVGASVTVGAGTLLMGGPAWAQTSAPNPAPQAPPGLDAAADTFLGWMKWGGLIAGILGLFISGVMMMVGRRNRSTTAVDGATGIPWVLGGLTTVSFASAIVGAVLT